MGLRPLTCWNRGCESLLEHGYLFLLSVVCCQVQVSASGWSPVQSSHTKCCMSECGCQASIIRRPWPTTGCCDVGKLSLVRSRETHRLLPHILSVAVQVSLKERQLIVLTVENCWREIAEIYRATILLCNMLLRAIRNTTFLFVLLVLSNKCLHFSDQNNNVLFTPYMFPSKLTIIRPWI
jgi:hypothetical protein